MNASSARPRVSELVFQLYGRPLHPELFEILAEQRQRRQGGEVVVRITRTGHLVSWENATVHLTEVAATCEQPLPERRRLLSQRMRGERSSRLACACGVCYQSSFQVEVLPPDIFLHVHDEILADGKRGLLHHFNPHHRLALGPLGYVAVESRSGCLFLTSFHTFPDEYTVVKSQSLIEIPS